MASLREEVAVIGSIFIFGSQWSKKHHKMFSAQDISSNLCSFLSTCVLVKFSIFTKPLWICFSWLVYSYTTVTYGLQY